MGGDRRWWSLSNVKSPWLKRPTKGVTTNNRTFGVWTLISSSKVSSLVEDDKQKLRRVEFSTKTGLH